MIRNRKFVLLRLVAIASVILLPVAALQSPASGQTPEPRFALVIGNSTYRSGSVPAAANDAGLIAETLRSAGFEVMGSANLDENALRSTFRDFLAEVENAPTNAVVFVYLSGRALQYAGENYFAPVDANITRDADAPVEAYRLSDFTHALAALPLRARIIVVDGARQNSFAQQGNPLASGLAIVEAEPETLYAYNAAPGTIAPDEPGPYGAYAEALTEMLREGGLPINDVFAQTRLRVSEATRGNVIPWDVSKIDHPIVVLARAAGAPPLPVRSYTALITQPINSFPADEAYAAAIERDTFEGYEDFLAVYPDSPFADRVRAIVAVRREALTWWRTIEANNPNAYWTYMQRYPHGPHFYDARRRLALIDAALQPPPRFDLYGYGGLLPPPPAEYVIIDRRFVDFDAFHYPPPPPPPIIFLPPRAPDYRPLPPPPSPQAAGFLPLPARLPPSSAQPSVRQGNFVQPHGTIPQQGNRPADPSPQPAQNNAPAQPQHAAPPQNQAPQHPAQLQVPGPAPVPQQPIQHEPLQPQHAQPVQNPPAGQTAREPPQQARPAEPQRAAPQPQVHAPQPVQTLREPAPQQNEQRELTPQHEQHSPPPQARPAEPQREPPQPQAHAAPQQARPAEPHPEPKPAAKPDEAHRPEPH